MMRWTNPVRPRFLRWYLAIAALVLAGAVLFTSGSARATSPRSPAAPRYLFSVPSAAGSLIGPSDRHLTLRLTGARSYLTRFTDRPLRAAAVVANTDFARRFAAYYAGSNPNAVLTYTPRGGHIPVSVVLTIGQPRWNAQRATWTFPAIRIRKQADNLPGASGHIKPPGIPNPRSFHHATLLIDDAADSGSCTIGDINYFPGSAQMGGYVRPLGQLLPVNEFSALSSVIGTDFGGDGVTNFKLPDLPDLQTNVTPFVCFAGLYPSPQAAPKPCMAGNVQLTAATGYARNGWLPADGRLHGITNYPALYAQIGTTFGGDGVQTFAVPDVPAPRGLQNIICANGPGWDPAVYSPQQCTLGELNLFATTSSPGADLVADGRLVPINSSIALFLAIGTTFGGDGSHTFEMPNPPLPLKRTGWVICGQGTPPPTAGYL